MANNASPVASAPAFVILLGLCAAIWTRCAGLPAPAALAVSLSAAAAWVFLGSRRAAVGFAPELAVSRHIHHKTHSPTPFGARKGPEKPMVSWFRF